MQAKHINTQIEITSHEMTLDFIRILSHCSNSSQVVATAKCALYNVIRVNTDTMRTFLEDLCTSKLWELRDTSPCRTVEVRILLVVWVNILSSLTSKCLTYLFKLMKLMFSYVFFNLAEFTRMSYTCVLVLQFMNDLMVGFSTMIMKRFILELLVLVKLLILDFGSVGDGRSRSLLNLNRLRIHDNRG